MRWLKFTIPLIGCVAFAVAVSTGPARAFDLTAAEAAHLEKEFGLRQDNEILKGMTETDRTRLHEIFEEPFTRNYPNFRDGRISDYLFGVYSRQCSDWSLHHPAPHCPPATNTSVQAGKEVADSQCNACHLLGTADAPGFFRLARQGGWDSRRLAAALDHGHRMSPIHLPAAQIDQLMDYIQSRK